MNAYPAAAPTVHKNPIANFPLEIPVEFDELVLNTSRMEEMALELHVEIHKHGLGQQAIGTEPPSTSSSAKTSKKKKNSDLKYDIFGWIMLAVGIVAWVGFAKSHVPPPPPR
ncbi:hypothetical protein F0562_018243 [Nyssa sinensis]|uniref:Uncharacterized protein n=1 Tax=Nyssa sinensis TaxID=561372 RepID=A0A5J4Z978_9ASTE|nr:hypothetical protein F0562_018243 [Nyssa sinensis]